MERERVHHIYIGIIDSFTRVCPSCCNEVCVLCSIAQSLFLTVNMGRQRGISAVKAGNGSELVSGIALFFFFFFSLHGTITC